MATRDPPCSPVHSTSAFRSTRSPAPQSRSLRKRVHRREQPPTACPRANAEAPPRPPRRLAAAALAAHRSPPPSSAGEPRSPRRRPHSPAPPPAAGDSRVARAPASCTARLTCPRGNERAARERPSTSASPMVLDRSTGNSPSILVPSSKVSVRRMGAAAERPIPAGSRSARSGSTPPHATTTGSITRSQSSASRARTAETRSDGHSPPRPRRVKS